MRREDVRAMLRIAPCDAFALHTDTAPPCVERYSAARIREIAAVVGLFVLHAGKVVQIAGLGQTGTEDLIALRRVITAL